MDKLPSEIFEKILGYLSHKDLMQVRLVNKQLYLHTCYGPIGKRFKIKIQHHFIKPEIYCFVVRNVRVVNLDLSYIMCFLKDYHSLEDFKVYHGFINIECLRTICYTYWQNLRMLECRNCDLCFETDEFMLDDSIVLDMPNLRSIKLVECCTTDISALIYLLEMGSHLEEFTFKSTMKSRRVFQTLSECLHRNQTTIRYLNVKYDDQFDNILKILKWDYRKLTTLKLELTFLLYKIEDVWRAIRKYSNLIDLRISVIKPTVVFFKNFTAGVDYRLRNLKRLDLDVFAIEQDGFRVIMSLPQLEQLNISCSVISNFRVPVKFNQNFNMLKLQMSEFIDTRPNVIQNLMPFWRNIKYLDLESTNVSNEDMQFIFKSWTQLEVLRLDECSCLTEESLMGQGSYKFPIRNLVNLEYLGLGLTTFTDRLCDTLRFSKLRVLHLFSNITIEGLRVIGANCPALEVVCPDKYHFIDPISSKSLKDYFPNIKSNNFICHCQKYFKDYRLKITKF